MIPAELDVVRFRVKSDVCLKIEFLFEVHMQALIMTRC